MGKKDKKKKVTGVEKTQKKTEKKLNAKQKKELAALGEDDIEKVVAQIEREEAKRQKVVEAVVGPPSRRVNFTLTPHPFKDELILLGGEFHDGRQTVVYGDMFFYSIAKNEWSVLKAPGAPPPRCGHQAVCTQSGKGELWVFGGEFSSPSESQFYHYRDLWCFHIGEKKWEKIAAPQGPSARSGHRMINIKKNLYIFGGFHDNLRDYKYFNDIHCFNMATRTWSKLETSGIAPAPRSGCIVLPTPEHKLLVYGGYSKERVKKDVDKGHIHTDMFILAPEKNDQSGLKWRWSTAKQGGITVSPRCSATAVLAQPGLAYMFGGVHDEEDGEEELRGTFFNDLVALNLSKLQWHSVELSGKSDATVRRRRRKAKGDGDEDEGDVEDEEEAEEEKEKDEAMDSTPEKTVITDDDGIFTVTLGPALSTNKAVTSNGATSSVFTPSARINPGLAVKNNTLYLYGGMFEDGDKQYTLNDFYALDFKKLDEWNTIAKDDLSTQVWLDSGSSGSDTEDDGSDDAEDDDDDDDEGDDDDEDEDMDVDDK